MPGIIEWPAVVRAPRCSSVHRVTSAILPAVLDLLGLAHPMPDRPLDGTSLKALIVEDLSLGTMPTTRNPGILFQNDKHPVARTADFGGEAAWTDNRYKLLARGPVAGRGASGIAELYDLLVDPNETTDIASSRPDVVRWMTGELRAWQRSVERCLTGADYR